MYLKTPDGPGVLTFLGYNELMDEILLVDKSADWTSFDVVAKIRGTLSHKSGKRVKVGHAGTLDPFATGLLIVLCGAKTKEQNMFMKLDKEYVATLKLGYVSTTGDPEGDVTKQRNAKQPTKEEIKQAIAGFIGPISQIPPKYSAIKIDGERAYKLARKGAEFEMKAREIEIYDISVISYSYPFLKIKVSCSSGTYVRTLAEDIGAKLNTGAYLTELRRTKIGAYSVADAKQIDFYTNV